MKITEELLKKHLLGETIEEEKKAIKEWFEQSENVQTGLQILEMGEQDKKEIWSMIQDLNPDLQTTKTPTKVIPLYRSAARYAATACIIVAAFFGGRSIAPVATATDAPEDPTADHLFITGGNGAKGNLSGDTFRVSFDGTVKLYNNSLIKKTVKVGDTSFSIAPRKSYYLNGNAENPKLNYYWNINQGVENGMDKDEFLMGDFSIHRLGLEQ